MLITWRGPIPGLFKPKMKNVKKWVVGKLWEKAKTKEGVDNKCNYYSMLSLSYQH